MISIAQPIPHRAMEETLRFAEGDGTGKMPVLLLVAWASCRFSSVSSRNRLAQWSRPAPASSSMGREPDSPLVYYKTICGQGSLPTRGRPTRTPLGHQARWEPVSRPQLPCKSVPLRGTPSPNDQSGTQGRTQGNASQQEERRGTHKHNRTVSRPTPAVGLSVSISPKLS